MLQNVCFLLLRLLLLFKLDSSFLLIDIWSKVMWANISSNLLHLEHFLAPAYSATSHNIPLPKNLAYCLFCFFPSESPWRFLFLLDLLPRRINGLGSGKPRRNHQGPEVFFRRNGHLQAPFKEAESESKFSTSSGHGWWMCFCLDLHWYCVF